MENLAVELIYHLSDHMHQFKRNTGQRWPELHNNHDILNFRAVCRGFRNASWLQFRDILAVKVFHLNVEELKILDEISQHAILGEFTAFLNSKRISPIGSNHQYRQ